MIKTFTIRELKTLWIWVAVVTHRNTQKGAGEDWLRNETSCLQEPVGISLLDTSIISVKYRNRNMLHVPWHELHSIITMLN